MSTFKNTRRIVDHLVQNRLLPPPPKIANCYKQLLKKDDLKVNQFEKSYNKRTSIVKKNSTPQAQPIVSNVRIIAYHTNISSRIYYEKVNKDKNLEKEVVAIYGTNKEDNLDGWQQLRRNMSRNITVSQHLDKQVQKPTNSDKIPQNHVKAPNKGLLSRKVRANGNQVIYHRVFNVPYEERQTSLQPFKNIKWFAKRGDDTKDTSRPGRLGKLGTSNESEYFYKTDRERLLELKKKLKDKEKGPDAPKKTG